MTRGVLYLTWPGELDAEPVLQRSIDSLKIFHSELPHHVVRLPEGATLLDKSRMADLSPFDQTLFLDADTVVCGKLDYGFEMAARHGIACCICECPYARRYGGLANAGDLREFNTGVIFWQRGGCAVQDVFDRWKRLARDLDSSILHETAGGLAIMPVNDQGSFAAAVDRLKFNPFCLPLNWNFRPIWQKSIFGPLRIWHDYDAPPAQLLDWSAQQSKPGAIIAHARLT